MVKWTTALILIIAFAAPAWADTVADARAHSEAFAKACETGDIKGVTDLYVDDATMIWPGAGEEATGKANIEKRAAAFCDPKTKLKLVLESIQAIPLDNSHMVAVGHWKIWFTDPHGKRISAQVRTTEVLVKTATGWRYLVDHASIGVPSAQESKQHKRKIAQED